MQKLYGLNIDYSHCYWFIQQVFEQTSFYLVEFLFWLDYQKSKIMIFLIFSLPVFKRLNISLFVHVLARLPKFLIVNYIDIGTLLIRLPYFAGYLFESFVN